MFIHSFIHLSDAHSGLSALRDTEVVRKQNPHGTEWNKGTKMHAQSTEGLDGDSMVGRRGIPPGGEQAVGHNFWRKEQQVQRPELRALVTFRKQSKEGHRATELRRRGRIWEDWAGLYGTSE
jgi:hypothetical protein